MSHAVLVIAVAVPLCMSGVFRGAREALKIILNRILRNQIDKGTQTDFTDSNSPSEVFMLPNVAAASASAGRHLSGHSTPQSMPSLGSLESEGTLRRRHNIDAALAQLDQEDGPPLSTSESDPLWRGRCSAFTTPAGNPHHLIHLPNERQPMPSWMMDPPSSFQAEHGYLEAQYFLQHQGNTTQVIDIQEFSRLFITLPRRELESGMFSRILNGVMIGADMAPHHVPRHRRHLVAPCVLVKTHASSASSRFQGLDPQRFDFIVDQPSMRLVFAEDRSNEYSQYRSTDDHDDQATVYNHSPRVHPFE